MAVLVLITLAATSSPFSFCDVEGWRERFNEEFNTLDSTIWTKDVRGPGDSRTRDAAAVAQNAYVENGTLVIKSDGVWDGARWQNYTSGAVSSQHKLSFRGKTRVCIKAKLPGGGGEGKGTGIWPAHWLMPDDQSCWPCHGEIDIMEMINGDGTLHGTYHWCVNSTCGDGPEHLSHGGSTPMPADWATAFHEYAVEYDGQTSVAFAVDGVEYVRTTTKIEKRALFWDTPYYIILNTAVGGPWPKPPTASTVFPTNHIVDSVRVVQAP